MKTSIKRIQASLKDSAPKGKKMKVKAAGVDLPKFRYVDDVTRFLDEMRIEINESGQVIKQQQMSLAHLKIKALASGVTFEIAPRDAKQERTTLRKMKSVIDPSLTKVVVPSLSKLKTQYALAEDLYEKHRTLEALETQLAMQFPDRRGESYQKAEGGLHELKGKVAEQLKTVLTFLNEVASKHVPKTFTAYMNAVADLISEEVIFRDSDLFLYVSVTDEGALVFSYYLMLIDAINDDGQTSPHLYISVQWIVGDSVYVQLNHEYEVPNALLRAGGTPVSDAGHAVKAISELLTIEQFSTGLGNVPLALQMKIDPSKINTNMFSFKDFIKSISVNEDSIAFTLRKGIADEKELDEVGYQLYKEIKLLVKGKDAKVRMAIDKSGSVRKIVFTISKVATGGEFNAYDAEFLRDKFSLSDAQLRKVVNILNSESK